MAYRDVVLTDSPVDFYEMETSTGTDSGSGGRTLTLSGITTDVPGLVGDGWSFDGVNDTASMATWPSLTTAFTFEAWVKPNLTGVSDTPTVIRRDGTDVMLLRVRGSALGVNPGQAEVYADGLTLLSTSSYRVDDGNWHHLVYTQSGNAAKLYVDGVERASGTTSQSTFNMGTGTGYIGSANGTGEWYKGVMDNAAIYSTALSAARVTAHYNAGVNGGYTAQPMTASTSNPDAIALGNVVNVAITSDTAVTAFNTSTVRGSDNLLGLFLNGSDAFAENGRGLFKMAAPGNGESVVSAVVTLKKSATYAQSGSVYVYRILEDWVEATTSWDVGRPALQLIKTESINSLTGDLTMSIDVTGADAGYGFALAFSSYKASGYYTKDHATPANRPYVTVTTAPQANASHTADVATASATMPNASVATTANGQYGAQAATASALMVDPSIEGQKNPTLDAEPMDASAAWPTTTGFALQVSVNADPATASAEFVDASVDVQRGPIVLATPLLATAEWKPPALVNDVPIFASETDDKYFQRVMADDPKHWYRLADTGSTADDRMTEQVGAYVGVNTGRFAAPDNRHSVYFDGTAYLEQIEDSIEESILYGSVPYSTLEFSFRTEKGNTFIMAGKDNSSGSAGTSPIAPREVYLKDGKITYRTINWDFTNGRVSSVVDFSGFKNLADNQWHHIVIRTSGLESNDSSGSRSGVEIWVDGLFEVRRYQGGVFTGFPDYVGSRPSSIDGFEIGALPSSQNFVGDMSEIVFYDHAISTNGIARRYYDFMGWTPIEAESMDAFAFSPVDGRGKGNQKRALYLWWTASVDGFSRGGDGFNNKMNFDPVLAGHGNFGIYDVEGYKVFSMGTQIKSNGQGYRDPVTDLPSLINLESDVDIRDYDVIMFGDWPDEGTEIDTFDTAFPGARERLIRQVRWASDQGTNILVTHPRLAVDLGIIDRVEQIATLKESKYSGAQGNALGNYDYGSAVKFPWNATASAGIEGHNGKGSIYNGQAQNTDPAFLANKAYYYEDMNFNNKFRVRATIDGLTNIPSYMIAESVFHTEFDSWGLVGTVGYKYLHRLNGLQIGDEFIFHGTNGTADWENSDLTGFRTGRPLYYFATPLANVKAGTVVTTFGATHYKEQSEVDNPYKDYATTIVLQPGDVLAGKPVNSRIFVNFTEQPNRFQQAVAVQDLPPVLGPWPSGYNPDSAAQREWEYTAMRTTVSSTQIGTPGTINVTMPDGSISSINIANAGGSLLAARSSQIFPINYFPRFDMVQRGLWWLQTRIEVNEGDARAVAAPFTATASVPEPVIVAQRDNGYTATPMVGLAQMTRVAESTVGDVEIRTLPATAHAEFTGFSKVISVEPMTATAELVESFDMVHTTGEQVILILHGVDATLYLKEDS